jgi:hypothetical protein
MTFSHFWLATRVGRAQSAQTRRAHNSQNPAAQTVLKAGHAGVASGAPRRFKEGWSMKPDTHEKLDTPTAYRILRLREPDFQGVAHLALASYVEARRSFARWLDADDLAQEMALFALCKHAHELDFSLEAPTRRYAHTTALRRSMRAATRARRFVDSDALDLQPAQQEPGAVFCRSLQRAFDAVPPKHRALIWRVAALEEDPMDLAREEAEQTVAGWELLATRERQAHVMRVYFAMKKGVSRGLLRMRRGLEGAMGS